MLPRLHQDNVISKGSNGYVEYRNVFHSSVQKVHLPVWAGKLPHLMGGQYRDENRNLHYSVQKPHLPVLAGKLPHI